MDKFWSIFTMPIGLMMCFGPIVIAWFIHGTEDKPSKKDGDKH